MVSFKNNSKDQPVSAHKLIRYSDFNYYASSNIPRRPPDPKPSKPRPTRAYLNIGIGLVVVSICAFAGTKLIHSSSAASIHTSGISAASQATTKGYDISTPSSITIIVNKARPLAGTYAPVSLITPEVTIRASATENENKVSGVIAGALKALFAAAKQDNISLMLSSGYRSYAMQTQLYNYYVGVQGQAAADEQSARPGYSEHQTGLAADIAPASGECDAQPCFANTPEGIWLTANVYRYGFVIRYPANKSAVTGYNYEPWHIRFVGTDLSTKLHSNNTETLEEYFKLQPATDYR